MSKEKCGNISHLVQFNAIKVNNGTAPFWLYMTPESTYLFGYALVFCRTLKNPFSYSIVPSLLQVSIWSIPHKKKRSPGCLYLVISEKLKVEKYERVEPTKNNFLAKVQFTYPITPTEMFSLGIMIQERKTELDNEKCQLKSGFCCLIKNYSKVSHCKTL